ncbi:hypothetical protein OG394_29090 [Kribbella sp. NBC_01245]|uniref:hypothetical protein n=1 Tax=Kribbella sp. NBC_01245 TaxID=2903578 RepID=UPI002E2BE808|nr:hypothetical protein [Kribbella sp. NBC_01245]
MSAQTAARLPTSKQRPPNTRMRSAREAHGLTRAELAEAVAAWIYSDCGQVVALDAHYIAKLERGVVRRARDLYRTALRAVLRLDSDDELGMTRREPGSSPPTATARFSRPV